MDYVSIQLEPITFKSGSVFGDVDCYSVTIVDDELFEFAENFTVVLSSLEPAFQETRATVIIHPDDNDRKYHVSPTF